MAFIAPSLTHFGQSAAVRPGIRCFIAADILLPLNGLLIAVFLGWVWRRRDALAACDLHTSRRGRLWRFSVRYIVPC